MNVSFLLKERFCLIVALLLVEMGCASSPAYVSPKREDPSLNRRNQPRDMDTRGDVSRLIGIWQGFWSLKGRVETDRHLFLDDGSWGWLATVKPAAADTVQSVVQRSGRWKIVDGVVVLTELRRKEFVGCKRDSSSDQSCEEKRHCEPCDPEYRIVRHKTPVIERLTVGECPNNEEAEALDREYSCLSIGERVFWRKAIPSERERDPFFGGM